MAIHSTSPRARSPRRTRWLHALAGLVLLASAGVVHGCETYDSPPRPAIAGITDGVLSDPSAPITVVFSEPIDPDSLRISIIPLVTDVEGNLPDEDDDEATVLTPFFSFDPVTANNFGGTGELLDGDTQFRMTLTSSLPIGPSLAVLIEPGLKDLEGREVKVRQRLIFGYSLSCDESSGGTDKFPSGAYFLIANIDKPIKTQIQLFGLIDVDTETGKFRGQFTNADRNPDPNRCDPACSSVEACRTLPSPECVTPSEEAGTEDEYPDYVPNDVLPAGYSFTVGGCVVDTGDGVAFVNLPADVDIQQPDVFVEGIQLISSFKAAGDGVFRGSGSVTASQVFIGVSPSGTAEGTLIARLIPEDEVPPGIPEPPPE